MIKMAGSERFNQIMSRDVCIMKGTEDNYFEKNIMKNKTYKSHKIIVYLKTDNFVDVDHKERAIENDDCYNYVNSVKTSNHKNFSVNKEPKTIKHTNIDDIIDCDSLHSNDEIIKDRLKFVGDQLVQFIKLEPININSTKQSDYNINTNNYDNIHHHHLKLKTIWNIYLKLLRAGPLDLYWNYKQDFRNDKNDNRRKLINTRQQVLCFIENLNGYCDSINMLRLILKSSTVIAVLEAYEDIVSEIEYQRLTNAKIYMRNNHNIMSNPSSKEWSV